jgi:cytochrome b involved in lipid metabolism
MSMKTFFTFFSFLFLGVLASVLIAGYISHENTKAREAYSRDKEEQIKMVSASLEDSQKKIELLEEKFKALEVAAPKEVSTTKAPTTATKPATTATTKPTPAAPSGTKLTSAVVAGHATAADCWIIVSGKVYSVSGYIPMHPGGKSTIVNVCGKDATTVFKNRGGTGEHSDSAWTMLGQFIVGAMGATVKL